MSSSIPYAAHTYLDEWLEVDREAHKALAVGSGTDEATAVEWLAKVASHYSVGRSFSQTGDVPRFLEAWKALEEINEIGENDSADCVRELTNTLKKSYHKELWSAASKFLWIRFRSPVIIYDQYAYRWVRQQKWFKENDDWYDLYCAQWRVSYQEQRPKIIDACEQLFEVRQFFRPDEALDAELQAALSSEWFFERVFDHFISWSGVEPVTDATDVDSR